MIIWGVGGPKQKFARNIEAIQTLRTLEQEHRGATAEEQQVLSQYVGWGGLADVFDPNKENWSAEYTQLKGLAHRRGVCRRPRFHSECPLYLSSGNSRHL